MNTPFVTRESVRVNLAVLGWLLMLAGGLLYFNKYETTPGATRPSPDRWPTAAALNGVSTSSADDLFRRH